MKQRILAGFLNRTELLVQAQWLNSMNEPSEKSRFWDEYRSAKTALSALDPIPTEVPTLDPLPAEARSHLELIESLEAFQENFGGFDYSFSMVPLSRVMPIQIFCNMEPPQPPPSSGDLHALLDYSLPSDVVVPAEIVLTQNGVRFIAARYGLTPANVRRRIKGNQVVLTLEHVNLFQIRKWRDSLVLYNGTHRAVEALRAGLTHLPALVLDFQNQNEMEWLQGPGFWSQPFLLGSGRPSGLGSRPPLISDFLTQVSLDARIATLPSVIDLPIGAVQQAQVGLPQGIALQIGGLPGR